MEMSQVKVKVFHYDAFSSIPDKGNPAGVVLDGGHLTDEQMREVAEKVGFNETAFPLASDKADLRIRFFTPGHEINLCGHATMATIYALATRWLLDGKTDFTIETKAGILPIRLLHSEDGLYITMRQAAPQFQPFEGSLKELSASIGIDESDLETEWPIVYGSTGTWTLLVPVKSLSACERMKPDNKRFPAILEEMPASSVHPFCTETYDSSAHMHARHFSSPYSGTIEDPVTGTASGVMGAYWAKYRQADNPVQLWIEQGQEIGRDGRVQVTVTNGDQVEITGTAVYVNEFEVSI
ncbi:PhzF family phenazine biosynthesis protein [Paenibacillus sp. NPDC058071]|uniref:PhzF family phenazine biosynthesis protein n=1 Tax=Paenibacillus sp. NPDC058071 TaxID=3346326 RepID=UPI0036DC9F08